MKEKRERMMLMKLRGGTAAFQMKVGKWQGVARDDRVCKECQSGEVEDVCHWLLQCPAWDHIRRLLLTQPRMDIWPQRTSIKKQTAVILSAACTNTSIMKCIRSMWCACFGL